MIIMDLETFCKITNCTFNIFLSISLWNCIVYWIELPEKHKHYFFLPQLWRAAAARLFHSGWQRSRIALHQSVYGSVFPAVLRVVVLIREPDHYEVSHLSPYASTPASPGGPGRCTDTQQSVPAL